MLLRSFYYKNTLTSQTSNPVTRTHSPAVQFPWLPALTLLGIPAVVIFLWILKHTLFGGLAFGWTALAELALPLGACVFAAIVFLVPNPMHALLSLLGVFFTTVLFYLAAGIAFVGLVFLIVYVGAVAVLFLFVIMLLNAKSLTSKDALLQHVTQWLAIVTAAVLLIPLSRVFAAVNRALMGWNTQLASAEVTSAEAVLFYVRFVAADINRLVGLYTTHSSAFLVTTTFLLVSLLGAIILATVTTERATALTDIREYGTPALAGGVVIALICDQTIITGVYPWFFDLINYLHSVHFPFNASDILLMSYWMKWSLRNNDFFRFAYERNDGAHRTLQRKVFFVVPKILGILVNNKLRAFKVMTKADVKKWNKKKAKRGLRNKANKEAAATSARITTVKKRRVPIRARLMQATLRYLGRWRYMPSHCRPRMFSAWKPVRIKSKSLVTLNTLSRRPGFFSALTAVYPKITAAVNVVAKKWNTRELLSYHQSVVSRSRWLWRWRPERTTSLLRIKKRFRRFSDARVRWAWGVNGGTFWRWAVLWAFTPLNRSTLGRIGYLRYRYSVRLLPFLYYYAWRARLLFSIWFFAVLILPFILVPVPWFLSEYWELVPQLRRLHSETYFFVERCTPFASTSTWIIKEFVTILLLYPAAALKIILTSPWGVITVAGLYALDTVSFLGSKFARAELHDSTCNYFRIRTDKTVDELLYSGAAAVALRRRHPDRGRTDLCLLAAVQPSSQLSVTAAAETTSASCPVSPDNIWGFLGAFADKIRILPPEWPLYGPWYDTDVQLALMVVTSFLVMAPIIYSLCSIFISLSWARLYKVRRPPLVWPVLVLLLFSYLAICLFPHLRLVAFEPLILYGYDNRWKFLSIAAAWWVSSRVIYEGLDSFRQYIQLPYGSARLFRHFTNYYFMQLDWVIEYTRPAVTAVAEAPLGELMEQEAERLGVLKAVEDAKPAKGSRKKYIRRTWDTSYYDPEPNPACDPCRAGSAEYLRSPFAGRPFVPAKWIQARRPLPNRTNFHTMFYPSFLLFTALPWDSFSDFAALPILFLLVSTSFLLPKIFIVMPAFFYNWMHYELSIYLSIIRFNTWLLKVIQNYLVKLSDFLGRDIDSSTSLQSLPAPLSLLEEPNVFISFLPEVTLAVIITYLIWIAAVELAANRAPKVLAIECWRAACWGLAFVAVLYCVQLLGVIQNTPAASGYLYVSKGLTVSKLFVTLTSLFVLHLSDNYIREHTRHILEFSVILLLAILLLLILVSANNLMLVFLALAGCSLSLYILILYDAADAASREASLKYFYLSTLSAGFILFGILLIYVTVGDVTYYTIRVYMNTAVNENTITVMSAAVLFILVGFFFKLSAFPGHLWAVEVYEGSPLPVMAFFMLPVKVAVFITFMRLLNTGLLEFSHIWLPAVTIAAIGSLLWGALAATQERKTTRFLGYASINQIGFLLLGLAADTDDALRSAFFYLILYVITTGGFLLIFTQLRKETGATFVALSDFRGLGKTENLVCWNLAVFLFSMAGIPPLAGFFGKYYLLASLMEKGLFGPVVIGLAVSLITAYYYLRIIKTFWFEEDIAIKPTVLLLSAEQRTLLSVLEAALWVAAVFAPWLLPALTETIATLAVCADASSTDVTVTVFNLFTKKTIIVSTCDPTLSYYA